MTTGQGSVLCPSAHWCPINAAHERRRRSLALSTTNQLGLSNGAQPGTNAAWTSTAPAGTTITGISYERYIGHQLDPFNDWSPTLRADGTVQTQETCLDSVENSEACFVGGPPGHGGEPNTTTELSAHELSLGINCQAPPGDECVTGATQHQVWAAMFGATITLSDPAPPTLTTPSGALWAPGVDHKGIESVTVLAQDVGGGVQNILLTADGHTVETYNARCDFTFTQPCPSSTGTQTLTLPTTELTDGTHTLALYATDAAGNTSEIVSTQITTDNTPPQPIKESAPITIQTEGPHSGPNSTGPSSTGNKSLGSSSTPKTPIHLTESLHGHISSFT